VETSESGGRIKIGQLVKYLSNTQESQYGIVKTFYKTEDNQINVGLENVNL